MSTNVYTSRVTNWPLFWLVAALAAVLCAAPLASGAGIVVPLVVGAALVLVDLMMTSLRTTVGPRGVVVRFGVFGVPRFRFPLVAITDARAESIPAVKLGGYGVHWSPWRGTRLTVRSGASLRLVRDGASDVVISVADPAQAVAVLHDYRATSPV